MKLGIVGLRRRVAQQAEGHARGLCHCSLLDVGDRKSVV